MNVRVWSAFFMYYSMLLEVVFIAFGGKLGFFRRKNPFHSEENAISYG